MIPVLALVQQRVARRGKVPAWLEDAFSSNATIDDAMRDDDFDSVFPRLHPSSAVPLVGQCVTCADGTGAVTLATEAALHASNFICGVVIETSSPGELIRVAKGGWLPAELVPSLGPLAEADGGNDFAVWNVDTLRIVRQGGLGIDGNTQIGIANTFGGMLWFE